LATYIRRHGTVEAARYEGPSCVPAHHPLPEAPDGVEWDSLNEAIYRFPFVRSGAGNILYLRPGFWVLTYPDGGKDAMPDAHFKRLYEPLEGS
jgi:hypothetical protein